MRVAFTIPLLLLSSIAMVSAQRPATVCRTESIAFRCPVSFTVVGSSETDGLFVARQPDGPRVGLFAVEIGNESADEKLNDLLDRVFQLLYARKFADFQLKDSRESYNVPDWRYSNFEEKRYQKVAFDSARSEMLHLHVVLISADGKRILAGFVRTFLEGNIAKSHFENWTMGSGSGPSELRILLHSITKEENREGSGKGSRPAGSPKRP